jgi:hypothetical protein
MAGTIKISEQKPKPVIDEKPVVVETQEPAVEKPASKVPPPKKQTND